MIAVSVAGIFLDDEPLTAHPVFESVRSGAECELIGSGRAQPIVGGFVGDKTLRQPEQQRWIYVFFQRSGDDDRDQRRLQRVYNTLLQYAGEDRFTIVTESAGQNVQLDFDITTDVCEDLIRNLQKIVGDQNIQVVEQPA